MKTTSEMRLVDINLLAPYINNARTHSPEQINKLREFGFVNPMIIDRDYNMLAGHERLAGAKAEAAIIKGYPVRRLSDAPPICAVLS